MDPVRADRFIRLHADFLQRTRGQFEGHVALCSPERLRYLVDTHMLAGEVADTLAMLRHYGYLPDETRQATPAESAALSRAQEVAQVPPEMYAAHLAAQAQLRSRLSGVGLVTASNTGSGNLCAIRALLQIKEGESESDALDEMAQSISDEHRQRQDPLGRALREGQGILGEPATLGPLMTAIFDR